MLEKVMGTIENHKMLCHGDKVLVGFSGGPDSLAMLHILHSLGHKYKIEIFVAHINHNLRGNESDADQKFVEEVCKKWGIPLFIKSEDVQKYSKNKKITTEEAGRQIRYDFFNKTADQIGAQKIAVAHNANDNAETILMRIIRGSGTEGLCGIKPVRDNIIRPLIDVKREEIEQYCKDNNLIPRIDSSNLDKTYSRNKIRLELIPYLQKEFNPNIIDTIKRMSNSIVLENTFLNEYANNILDEVIINISKEYISINLDKITRQSKFIIPRILRCSIERLTGSLEGIENINILDMINFMEKAKTGSTINLPRDLTLKMGYDEVHIIKGYKKPQVKEFFHKIIIPGKLYISETNGVLEAEIIKIDHLYKENKFLQMFDADKIKEDLTLRNRRDGDIFSPKGMKGSKKLKEYFIDGKIPKDIRNSIPLVALGKDILWIIGYRGSQKYGVGKNTENVLVLKYSS